ncbi:hypothetical protein SAMN05421593_3724 [Chryseobacterium culicis]|uniref:Uncharacterized protein n=1 Tax=Chryseobacterium culicis TaxID=680127 RepID=A0A1H6HY65_CHRCI|nr:hypothetical protein SAMN05421593_3724 [Chryseobacterium culicis]
MIKVRVVILYQFLKNLRKMPMHLPFKMSKKETTLALDFFLLKKCGLIFGN